MYKVTAILNTIGLLKMSIVISYIHYDLDGWDVLIIVFIVWVLIGLFIANSITFVISQKFCIKLYLSMERIDESIKKSQKKQDKIINIILIIFVVCFVVGFLMNTV